MSRASRLGAGASRRPCVAVAVAVAAMAPSWAFAQFALVGKTAWTTTSPAPTFVNPADTTGINRGATTAGGASAVGIASAQATLTDNNTNQSLFNIQKRMQQTFHLNTASFVQVPSYLVGSVDFAGGAVNSAGSATYTVEILDSTNAVVFTSTRNFGRTAAAGSGAVNDRFVSVTPAALAMGDYTVRTQLTINAQTRLAAAGGSKAGATISDDFFTARRGGATAIGGWADGLTDSRANIKAPAARTKYNVDGTGITVGVLEGGRAYIATDPTGIHSSLSGAGKLTLTNNATASDAKYRNEHTQAVASIIAGKNPTSNDPALNGVAPGAKILSAAATSYAGADFAAKMKAGLDDLVAAGVRIINASFGFPQGAGAGTDPDGLGPIVTAAVNARPELLFVKSAGNSNGGPITAPGNSLNCMAVGGLDTTHTRVGAYSSTGTFGGQPFPKPDIVAPGEQILVASALPNVYTRAFMGEAFDQVGGSVVTGVVTGTSFAAPHVAGAAALMRQKGVADGTDTDHRVFKAVMMNAADRSVLRSGGGAWAQTTTGTVAAGTYQVTRNLDPESGSGKLDTLAAMDLYAAGEARVADTPQALLAIDVKTKRDFWDLQAVGANDSVSYLLGGIPTALKAVVDWDQPDAGRLPELELRLYREGTDGENIPGIGGEDVLLATTKSRVAGSADQNVGLFDLKNLMASILPPPGDPNAVGPPEYFLSVFNLSNAETSYGLAVDYLSIVPEPTTGMMVFVLAAITARRGTRRI